MMEKEKQLVKIEHLYKEFDSDTKVLKDINLTINKNEVIAILGPSGTGKSTLLRCLNYLTEPTSGVISISDVTVDAAHHTKKEILELRKHSSMVFQSYNLFKNKTAEETKGRSGKNCPGIIRKSRNAGKEGFLSFKTLRRSAAEGRNCKSTGG